VKFGFIAKHRGVWPLRWMCEVLDVSPGGFYGWLSRPPNRRSREDEDLVRQIHRSFAESDRTYGVRRVWPDLLAWGFDVGRERVARLMRRGREAYGPPSQAQAAERPGARRITRTGSEPSGSDLHGQRAESAMGGGFQCAADKRRRR
jgi:putative transposase